MEKNQARALRQGQNNEVKKEVKCTKKWVKASKSGRKL